MHRVSLLAAVVASGVLTAAPATARVVEPDRVDVATSATAHRPPAWPRTIDGGAWPTSHLQGVAVDERRGEVLWSFTQQLVRTELDGTVLGTVEGITGHLGDIDLGPDGRVYGSLEYKDAPAFYIAIIDPRKVTRVGVQAREVMTTVHLQKVVDDFTADLDGDGRFDGDTADTADHRYGSSGIDGVAFGPRFGERKGRQTLKVAYGVYENVARVDNDNQVILEYDTSRWKRYERPLDEAAPHRSGPREPDGTFFVHTGNTRYGVQNLEFDASTGDWYLAVYPGSKPQYPNHSLFVVDGAARPYLAPVRGQARPERGWHLTLTDEGAYDPATTTTGWSFDASYGLVSLGHGLFYGGSGAKEADGRQRGTATLLRWTGTAPDGFVPVP